MSERGKELFGLAIELPSHERDAFVAAACGEDLVLRRRLEHLLRAHDAAGDFLDHPQRLVDVAAGALAEGVVDGFVTGDRIDQYELLERLGNGGFGSVWRARQLAPIEREVALKIRHAFERGDERFAARFLVEQQTLARMQHPGIAVVFDAGATAEGRSWLAMELIDGVPITRHCRERAMPLRARLELFVEVCKAVQHAHGKGVVHLDLKPANVLVTRRDGRDQAVVIDFGIARARGDEMAADAEPASFLGTPEYTSPEQAARDRSAVDTRTDVHALGVLLYELCCGERPFVRGDGPEAVDQLLQRIRTVAPEPPSRLSRQRLPRGLDWITARAMAKEPTARYPTAIGLAEDVGRMLRHEPVQAAPASAFYTLRCLVRRRWAVVAMSAGMVLSIAVGGAIAARGWQLASAAERSARADQILAEQASRRADLGLIMFEELWGSADSIRLARPDYTVRQLLDDAARDLPRYTADEPIVELRMQRVLARLRAFLGAYEESERHIARAVALSRQEQNPAELVRSLLQGAFVRFQGGNLVGAIEFLEEVFVRIGEHPELKLHRASALECLARCRWSTGDHAEALRCAAAALVERETVDDPLALAGSLRLMGTLHATMGRPGLALEFFDRGLAQLDPGEREDFESQSILQQRAFCRQQQGDLAAAESDYRQVLAMRRRTYGDQHSVFAWAQVELAGLLNTRRQFVEAEPLLRSALAILQRDLPADHHHTLEATQRLTDSLVGLRRLDEAEPLIRHVLGRYRDRPQHWPESRITALKRLGWLHWEQGRRSEARAALAESVRLAERDLPADHFIISVHETDLAFMAAASGDLEASVELLADALRRSSRAGRFGEVRTQSEQLASQLGNLGRHDVAIENLSAAVDAVRPYEDRDALGWLLLQRAHARYQAGDFPGAIGDAEEVRVLPWNADEDRQPHTATALDLLAKIAWRSGDPERALPLAEEALSRRERLGHLPSIAQSLHMAAMLHGSLGRPAQALALIERSQQAMTEFDECHPEVLAALRNHAFYLQQLGDQEGAEFERLECLARVRRAHGDDHVEVAWAQVERAWSLRDQGCIVLAEELLRAALPVLAARLVPEHLHVTEAICRLGILASDRFDLATAEPLLHEAVERYRWLPGHPKGGLVAALNALSRLHWSQGRIDDAVAVAEASVALARQALAGGNYMVSQALAHRAWLAARTGDHATAVELLRDALARSSAAGRTLEAGAQREQLVASLWALGRHEEACLAATSGR